MSQSYVEMQIEDDAPLDEYVRHVRRCVQDALTAPETIDVVLLNRPESAPTGAGEPTIRVIAAALANAFFDAPGVRLRRAPLTPERVKAALART